MISWTDYAKFFIGLLAIMNPIGIVPVFISLTLHKTNRQRNTAALHAAITVAVVLVVSLLMGEGLLGFFGISVDSFRVAGGILILLMAISMLHGGISAEKQTPDEAHEAEEKEHVGVVPLGIPLLAGPGAISTIIIYSHRGHGLGHHAVLFGIALVLALLTWLALRAGPLIADGLGRTGLKIVSRIMGLLLAAIGVEFITNGLRQLFPGLG
ncbi:MAG: YchE family NAAT transporter [Thiohalobacteraceae bacterium]|nr:YchE family NAAT transporter [Gammaproteobacteria bacterium]